MVVDRNNLGYHHETLGLRLWFDPITWSCNACWFAPRPKGSPNLTCSSEQFVYIYGMGQKNV